MTINEAWFAGQARRLFPNCMVRASSVPTCKALYGLVSLMRPRHVVEVGTFEGDATVWIARALIENKIGTCTSYDIDNLGPARMALRQAFSGDPVPVTLAHEDITQGKPGSVDCDFAFIDPDPKSLYLPAFRALAMPPGALLCAHDLFLRGDAKRDVQALRTHLETLGGWEIIGFPQERGLLVARFAHP